MRRGDRKQFPAISLLNNGDWLRTLHENLGERTYGQVPVSLF